MIDNLRNEMKLVTVSVTKMSLKLVTQYKRRFQGGRSRGRNKGYQVTITMIAVYKKGRWSTPHTKLKACSSKNRSMARRDEED